MNALVMNCGTLGVTEYTQPMTGVSDGFFAAVDGVYATAFAKTATRDPAHVVLGSPITDSSRRQRAKYLYLFGDNLSRCSAEISTAESSVFTYSAQTVNGHTSRFTLGAGIRSNYLTVGVKAPANQLLVIDRLEFFSPESNTRRL